VFKLWFNDCLSIFVYLCQLLLDITSILLNILAIKEAPFPIQTREATCLNRFDTVLI